MTAVGHDRRDHEHNDHEHTDHEHTDHDGHGHHEDSHHDRHEHDHHEPRGARVAPSVDDERIVVFEQRILAKNDDLAAHNRAWLAAHDLVAVNLMSAPGSGKTTLLERTIRDLGGELRLAVIEGDQETLVDAERIEASGGRVVQINTGSGCHLDADMTARGLRALDPGPGSVVIIENVGNLVCPALFDLGETGRVVIMSTTEGPDKPLKYPQMFADADLVLINKVDLLPYLDVTLEQITGSVRSVNATAKIIGVSASRGQGLPDWYTWLKNLRSRMSLGLDSQITPA